MQKLYALDLSILQRVNLTHNSWARHPFEAWKWLSPASRVSFN